MKRISAITVGLIILMCMCFPFAADAQYSPEVHQAQKALKQLGYNPGKPDGYWGKATESAIKRFQGDVGIPVTGILDAGTRAKLGLASSSRSGKQNQTTREKRIALVFGNSDYRTAPLSNPINDAKDMADALRNIGFEVIERINADKKEMILSIDKFYENLRRSDVGVFYYAGHGMQLQGVNYLIPVEHNITSETDVQFDAVDAGRVLGKMKSAGNKLNIVILDACRDNPFKRSFRTERQGLAQMDAPKGTIIAYATSPGSVAADGTGRNGIYTKHLLENIKKPNLDVKDILNETGLGVMQETGDKQVPWVSTTPIPRYYLAGGGVIVRKPSSEPFKSKIAITSNVSGARVLIDGREVGTTPVSGVTLSPGSHRIRVEKKGFESYQKQIRVDPGRTFSMQVYLDEARPKNGRLYVDTDPKGAKVNIQGIGKFYQGIELDPGRHRVEVSASGYETKELSVTVDAGEDKSLDIRLEKLVSSGPNGDGWKDPVIGMEFVWVPEGCYEMGCGSWGGGCQDDEKPVHEVCVDGFWIGKYEVTQSQWKKVMGNNPSNFKKGDNYPVEMVSWNDGKVFIKRLNQKSGGNKFRLPSEAEWEYAARSGGKPEKYAGGNNVDAVAWYWENGGKTTHPVGTKAPNGLDVYDMSGNVWEWCEDIYSKNAYGKHQRNNPIYTEGGSYRVFRGGSWNDFPRGVRSANRDHDTPDNRFNYIGVRLVRTP